MRVRSALLSLVFASLLVASLSCASLQPPTPARGYIDRPPQDAFSVAMQAVTQSGYTVTEAAKASGLIVAMGDHGIRRVTVTLVEQNEGTSVTIKPQSRIGKGDAEEAAQSIRQRISQLQEGR